MRFAFPEVSEPKKAPAASCVGGSNARSLAWPTGPAWLPSALRPTEHACVLIAPDERIVLSSLGWVDGAALWMLPAGEDEPRRLEIPGARYLGLHRGTRDAFAIAHHGIDERFEVSARLYAHPQEVVSRLVVSIDSASLQGDLAVWSTLPRHFVAQLKHGPGTEGVRSASRLVWISSERDVHVQSFPWYDDAYDKARQAILSVTEIPGDDAVIVSIQRDSTPIIHDPTLGRKVGEIPLAGRHGGANLQFCRRTGDLWAEDYDTLLRIHRGTWTVLAQERIEEAGSGLGQFIGAFSFDVDSTRCVVARPFSGDVVAVDPVTLQVRAKASVGRQPLEAVVRRDGTVVARDWKSGDPLRGLL